MKKAISIIILAAFILQSCVAYQKTSVSLDEAHSGGKVKVISTSGNSYLFSNIEMSDSTYYGMKDKIKVPLDAKLITSIYLQDIKKSKTQSAIFGLSVAAGLIGLFILLVSTMTFSIQL